MIRFLHVRNRGVLEKERLVFKADEPVDLGRYFLFKTTLLDDDHVSSRVESTYWFPDKIIKIGDLIIVYSKIGTESDKTNEDKTKSHFFYWDSERPLWSKKDDCPVLSRIGHWEIVKFK